MLAGGARNQVDNGEPEVGADADVLRTAALMKSGPCGPLRGQSAGFPPGSRPLSKLRHPDLTMRQLAILPSAAPRCGVGSSEIAYVARGLAA